MFSLRYKQLLVIIAGTLISFGMYLLVQSFGNFIISNNYLNESSENKRLTDYKTSFQDYISRNHVSIKNIKGISKWIKNQKYVYLIIYNGDDIIYESGYWDDKFSIYDFPEPAFHSKVPLSEISGYKDFDFKSHRYLCNIKFNDKEYNVSFIDSSETKWYHYLTAIAYGLFFICLYLFIMLYNHYIIHRIVHLSKEVSLIENGNLELPIIYNGNDEISLLAKNANNMRNSLIARHKSEKEAWDANSELITAMSHDIRTPLTSIIGYLEILDSKSYHSEEQLEKYIRSCKEKSIQLKDLSDKLFQYFLVFGKETIIMERNTFDVQILFRQLLYEHIFELSNLGFDVKSDFDEQSCIITADILYLKRLFDNLFSNIIKYANINGQVRVIGYIDDNYLIVILTNEIRTDSVLLDSTNIGLKTCKKIVDQMNGTFEVFKNNSYFQVKTVFPIERNTKE